MSCFIERFLNQIEEEDNQKVNAALTAQQNTFTIQIKTKHQTEKQIPQKAKEYQRWAKQWLSDKNAMRRKIPA